MHIINCRIFHDTCLSSQPLGNFTLHDSELPHAMIKTNGRPAGQQSIVFPSCLLGLFSCEENFLWLDKKKGERGRRQFKMISIQTKKNHVCLRLGEQKRHYKTSCLLILLTLFLQLGRFILWPV